MRRIAGLKPNRLAIPEHTPRIHAECRESASSMYSAVLLRVVYRFLMVVIPQIRVQVIVTSRNSKVVGFYSIRMSNGTHMLWYSMWEMSQKRTDEEDQDKPCSQT